MQRARWKLAVLAELAQPAPMELVPVRSRGGVVLDFEWHESSPLATMTLGWPGEEMFGRRLRKVFAGTPLLAPLYDTYLRTLLSRRPQFVRVEAESWCGTHHARPSPHGVIVLVTNASAVERVIDAQRAVRGLELSGRLQVLKRFIGWDEARTTGETKIEGRTGP